MFVVARASKLKMIGKGSTQSGSTIGFEFASSGLVAGQARTPIGCLGGLDLAGRGVGRSQGAEPLMIAVSDGCRWQTVSRTGSRRATARKRRGPRRPRRDSAEAVDSIWWTRATHLAGRARNAIARDVSVPDEQPHHGRRGD
jgi:hypothetical protein